jgi:hypothetical protein
MPDLKPPRFLLVTMVLFLSVETPVAAEPPNTRARLAPTAGALGEVPRETPATLARPRRLAPQLLSAQ